MTSKIKYHLLKSRMQIKVLFGLRPAWNQSNSVLILCYHGVVKKDPLRFNSRFVSSSDFEMHLNFFTTNERINIVSLDQLLNNEIDHNKLNIALTFDDGLENNYSQALPLLIRNKVPASFCVSNLREQDILWNDLLDIGSKLYPDKQINLGDENYNLKLDKQKIFETVSKGGTKGISNFIEQFSGDYEALKKETELTPYWKLMSDIQLKEISKNPLFEIIPHGAEHLRLKFATTDDARFEIKSSIEKCKENFGDSLKYCLAYSENTIEVNNILNELNIKYILGTSDSKSKIIDRFTINPHVNSRVLMHFIMRGSFTK